MLKPGNLVFTKKGVVKILINLGVENLNLFHGYSQPRYYASFL